MQPAKLAKIEQVRSSRLKRTIGLDSVPEGLFDEMPKQAKEMCGVKTTSTISSKVSSSRWLDKRHLWFKAKTAASQILDSEGKTMGVILVFNDMAMQRQMAEELSYRTTHDMLTGLVNPGEFEHRLQKFINENRGLGLQNALMYIDLDQLKPVNDDCGRSAGDALLKEVGGIMQSCIRNADTLARIGDNKFAVILYQCDTAKAIAIAKKICRSIESFRFMCNEQCFRIDASLGLVMIDKTGLVISV